MNFVPLCFVLFSDTYVHTAVTKKANPAPVTCAKCVVNKAGKSTCCARGGSWFKRCGKTDDSKFEHTWDEGIKACEKPDSGVAQAQAMLSNQTNNIHQQQNGRQNSISTGSINKVDETRTVNCRGFVRLSNAIEIISLFLTLMLYI